MAAVVSDWFFIVPALRVAEARAGATTWVYRFDHPDPAANDGFGASHAVEIPFVFDTIDREDIRPLSGDTLTPAVAATAHGAWVAFITDGTPGWDPYTPDDRATGLLTETLTQASDPSHDERVLWDGIR
jgi:para-nitrobenzyl esterase